MDLLAFEDIKRVKYRYLRSVDLKRWDELADTLAPEATADYGTPADGQPLSLSGRAAITSFLREKMGPGLITTHFATHPEIEIDGDDAIGTWALEDTVIATEYQVMIRGAAFYEDRYRRCGDGRWRITHTGYTRTYELMLSLKDLPSLRLTANRWAQPAP
jgi:SnoaL-like domain